MSIFDEFVNKLHYADPPSIDAFLDTQDEKYFQIGKIGIALALLPYEKSVDCLFQDDNDPNSKVYPGGHWYRSLWWSLTDGFRELKYFGRTNALTVITFNYDRSLECYLFTALTQRYPETITWDEHVRNCQKQFDEGVKIFHVYGKLGDLPWQTNDKSKALDYGTEPINSDLLVKCAANIKTISEARSYFQDDKFFDILCNNNRIYFIGFGFHKENLEILGIDKLTDPKDIRGTCRGLPRKEKEVFLASINDNVYPPIHDRIDKDQVLVPTYAYDFLKNYITL